MNEILAWIRRLTLIAFVIKVIQRIIAAIINALRVYQEEMSSERDNDEDSGFTPEVQGARA